MSDLVDFNILNRATFDTRPIKQTIRVGPTLFEGSGAYNLGSSVFWIKNIGWKFGYFDVGMYGAKKTPIKPVQVTIGGGTEPIMVDSTEPFPPFSIPKPIATRIDFSVKNTNLGNNHQLVVEFILQGVLVTPKPGVTEPLTLKEQLGYIMSSDSRKGELAMAEAAVDALEEKMASMGMESIRSKLPQGLGILKALPPSLQQIVVKQMNGEQLQALPSAEEKAIQQLTMNNDPERDKSAFIGDLITILPEDCALSKEQLKALADSMIQQGWRRV